MSDQPDLHICEHCFAARRFGSETTAFMFGNHPECNYLIFTCPACPNIDVVPGVSPELFRSFHPEVRIRYYPVMPARHMDRFLRNIDVGKTGCDALERDRRLEMLAESAKSLFAQPED